MDGRKTQEAMSEEDARRDILEKRAFYGKYEQRLLGFLEGKSIHPLPNFTDVLTGTGALSDPGEGIGDAGEDRYLYLLRAGGKVYGLSCGGLLRDLTPGAGGKPPIFDVPFGSLELYYDQDAKVFFDVSVDGDYYHGYDVDCSRLSKGYAVALYNRHMIDYLRESCAEGDIPYGVMIDMFEEAPDDVKYDVPDDYYKKNFAHREINPEW